METYKVVIDLEEERHQDVIRKSAYPKNIWDAKGVLIQEDKGVLPSYQQMPGLFTEVAHNSGAMSDEAYVQHLAEIGALDPKEKMFQLEKAIAGLNTGHGWGRNVYFTSLLLSGDLQSKDRHAMTLGSEEWDYYFKPGTFRLGFTGRTLVDKAGNEYLEELHIKITPDMVYDATANGGFHNARVGILTKDGRVEVVYSEGYGNGQFIDDKFPDEEDNCDKFCEGSNFKEINLTELVEKEGLQVKEHAFLRKISGWEGIYIFSADYDSLPEFLGAEILLTDNVVWKFAKLDQEDHNPNTFLRYAHAEDDSFAMYDTHARYFNLGGTGRHVRVQNLMMKNGYEAPACWQLEYISLPIDRNMLVNAMFGLGERLTRLMMYDDKKYDTTLKVIHEPSTGTTLENRYEFDYAKWKAEHPAEP